MQSDKASVLQSLRFGSTRKEASQKKESKCPRIGGLGLSIIEPTPAQTRFLKK